MDAVIENNLKEMHGLIEGFICSSFLFISADQENLFNELELDFKNDEKLIQEIILLFHCYTYYLIQIAIGGVKNLEVQEDLFEYLTDKALSFKGLERMLVLNKDTRLINVDQSFFDLALKMVEHYKTNSKKIPWADPDVTCTYLANLNLLFIPDLIGKKTTASQNISILFISKMLVENVFLPAVSVMLKINSHFNLSSDGWPNSNRPLGIALPTIPVTNSTHIQPHSTTPVGGGEREPSTIAPVSRDTKESSTHWWSISGVIALVVILIILSSDLLKSNSSSSSIPIIKSVKTPTDAPQLPQTQLATVSVGEQNAVQDEQTNNSVSQAVVETRLRIEQEVERANLATKMRNDLANLKKAEIEERQKRQEAEKRESNGVLALPTAPTQSLPSDGYIQSENFIWEPIQATATWDNAQSICLHSTKLGYKWRQPTAKELLSLYQKESNVLRIRGWTLGDTWSSNEGVFWGSNHNVVNLALGSGGVSSDSKGHYVSCVADRR